MEATASKFESTDSSLRSMLSSLMGQLEVMSAKWQGAGGMSFQQVKTQWNENMQKMSRALSETATAVRTSGTNYSGTDDSAQQRVAATGRDMTLPL